MRKIYSLVLMTAMLFIGANAWAKNFTGNTGAELQDSINAILAGTESDPVIKLTQKVLLNDQTIWVGTEDLTGNKGQYKSITLDLNGFDIEKTATTGVITNMFVITHGELKVINSAASEAQVCLKGRGHENSDVFFVCGSYRSSRWNEAGTALSADSINTRSCGYFTHLEIGERVKVVVENEGTGINVNNILKDSKCNGYKLPKTVTYQTALVDIYTTKHDISNGFAFGLRVDVKGSIIVNNTYNIQQNANTTTGKTYGIKVNGTMQSPTNLLKEETGKVKTLITQMNGAPVTYLSNYVAHNEAISLGHATHMQDTVDAPYIRIYPSANLFTAAHAKKSAPIYASGYAKWLIEGTCEGMTGIYISSGVVDLNNANVSSNATTYTGPAATGGANGGGSGIVVNSRGGSYSGDVEVTVSGDTKVESTVGYAMEEIVNTPETPKIDKNGDTVKVDGVVQTEKVTKVQTIEINGGTFEGGKEGAIAVSEQTVEGTNSTVVVYGATLDGESHIGTDGDLGQITPSGYHPTEIINEDGSKTIVISQGNPPDENTTVSGATANTSVTWRTTSVSDEAMFDTIKVSLKLTELVINDTMTWSAPKTRAKSQTLTINAGQTLEVERVMLGDGAQIIVEAGAKFLVTGNQGINAPKTSNIVLKADATNQALFVISDKVSSNRQPNATVQLYTSCYRENATTWKWQRFATPLTATASVTHDRGTNIYTSVKYMDDMTGHWNDINAWSDLKPFMAASITNNLAYEDTKATYIFPGKLMGNVTDSIKRRASNWNYYGNTYVAPISTKGLLNVLNQSGMSKVIYVWDFNAQGYTFVNPELFGGEWGDEGLPEIPAMGFFVLRNLNGEAGLLDIDYKNSIFNFAKGIDPVLNAPARNNSSSNRVRINVQAENGMSDVVYLLGNDNFTAEYEDGHDAEKLMNDGINLYVAGDMNLSMLYTDDIQGTLLTLQTGEDINYTMTFGKVNGEVYALRDNITNAVVLMNEGATYNFTAQPNATLEGRFEIVSRQEMPTAVETIEETVAPKAIYTIMGQYVGETTDWNTLPAGVYVVDGVKVIK